MLYIKVALKQPKLWTIWSNNQEDINMLVSHKKIYTIMLMQCVQLKLKMVMQKELWLTCAEKQKQILHFFFKIQRRLKKLTKELVLGLI